MTDRFCVVNLCVLLLGACNAPPAPTQQVAFRDGLEAGEPNSGERGTVKISEVMWSGSVDNDGAWDPGDVYFELRNESNRPVNISRWQVKLEGVRVVTWVIPQSDREILVNEHVLVVAKTTGCFPEAEYVIPEMSFSYGDPFRLTLIDADDRLIEPVGSSFDPPFAGGYDGQVSRSMERAELMFGGQGTLPHIWHFYSTAAVQVPNNDRIDDSCRDRTHGSPGRANSPDYSGAFASGSLE